MWGWSLLGGMITSIFGLIGWFVGIALVLYIAYELFKELFFTLLFLAVVGFGFLFWEIVTK